MVAAQIRWPRLVTSPWIAAVAPGSGLGGQGGDQFAEASGGGPTGPGGLGGPAAAGDQLAVPAQDRARGDEQPEAAADG